MIKRISGFGVRSSGVLLVTSMLACNLFDGGWTESLARVEPAAWPVIEIADTVLQQVDVAVRIATVGTGDSCSRASRMATIVSDLLVSITPHNEYRVGATCESELVKVVHSTTVRFSHPGTAMIRVTALARMSNDWLPAQFTDSIVVR